MVRGLVGGSHVSCKCHIISSKKQAFVDVKDWKSNDRFKECNLDERIERSSVLSGRMTVKADVVIADPHELYLNNCSMPLNNDEHDPECITCATNTGIETGGVKVNLEQLGLELKESGCESKRLGCQCGVCLPAEAVENSEQRDSDALLKSIQNGEAEFLNPMKQARLQGRNNKGDIVSVETELTIRRERSLEGFENAEVLPLSTERTDTQSVPRDDDDPHFCNESSGCMKEFQPTYLCQAQDSIKKDETGDLLGAIDSGSREASLVAGFTDEFSSDMVEMPSHSGFQDSGLQSGESVPHSIPSEGECRTLSSVVPAASNGETVKNSQNIANTLDEILNSEPYHELHSWEVNERREHIFCFQQNESRSSVAVRGDFSNSGPMDFQASEKKLKFDENADEELSPVERKICSPKFQGDVDAQNYECSESQAIMNIGIPTVAFANLREDYKTLNTHSDKLGGLEHALNLIMSLDAHGNFLDPVDELLAPNYSKIVNVPMCFNKMKEKVQAQQYRSWQAFVDDFERICYNAMKYNQNRSNVWRAAKKLLGEGKKLLEKLKGECKPTDFIEVADSNNLGNTTQNSPIRMDAQNVSRRKDEPVSSSLPISQYYEAARALKQPAMAVCFEHKTVDEMVRVEGIRLKEASDIVGDSYLDQCAYLRINKDCNVDSNMQVNIDSEEVQTENSTLQQTVQDESDSQSTEESSSFGGSSGDGESDSGLAHLWDNTEIQSGLRNSSGNLLSPEDDMLFGERNERKKALKQEWKIFRRGIEWRCRWLEIRVKALQEQASRYDKFLAESQVNRPWRTENGWNKQFTSRAVPFTHKQMKQHVLLRKRRRKLEDSIDPAPFMSRHPLFSRYEKKKQEQDDPQEGISDNHQSGPLEHPSMVLEESVQLDESDLDESPSLMKWTTFGEDSIEELWSNFESLQVRVAKLQNQLIRRVLMHSNEVHSRGAGQNLEAINMAHVLEPQCAESPVASPKDIAPIPKCREGPSKVAPSNSLALKSANAAKARRQMADYDISTVVMPVTMAAKYVEPVHHARIETPGWRRLTVSSAAHQSIGGGSSEEDTDEELYIKKHSQMEVKEKLQRMPYCLKRHMDESGTSTMYRVAKVRGKFTNMSSIEGESRTEDLDNNSTPEKDVARSASLTKGKRSRRDSRGTFSRSRGRQLSRLFAGRNLRKSSR